MQTCNSMIVRSTIEQTKKRKKSILVLQRCLRMEYKTFISSALLERRMHLHVETA